MHSTSLFPRLAEDQGADGEELVEDHRLRLVQMLRG